MSLRRVWLLVLIGLFAAAPGPLVAQEGSGSAAPTAPERGRPRSYWKGLYGCWDVSGAGKDRPGARVWLAHDPSRGNSLYGLIEYLAADGSKAGHDFILDALPTFEGGHLVGRVGPAQTPWDLTVAADGSSISGTWGGEPTAWKRRIPEIRELSVTTSRAALAYWNLRTRWNEGRENLLTLVFRGERLPTLWTQALDVECDDPTITRERWRVLDDGSIELRLLLGSTVRPGRKTLMVNGAEVAFDLAISDFQEPDAAPLMVWMRRSGPNEWVACDEPMRYGEDWRLRVMFTGESPKRDIIEIDLEGESSGRGVVLAYRDPKSRATFETRVIRIMPTAPKEGSR